MHDIASRNDSSADYYRSLINTFVNAIYVYDTGEPGDDPKDKRSKKRKLVIAFNTSGSEHQVTLEMFEQAFERIANRKTLESRGFKVFLFPFLSLILLLFSHLSSRIYHLLTEEQPPVTGGCSGITYVNICYLISPSAIANRSSLDTPSKDMML